MRISRFAALVFITLLGGLVIMGGLQVRPSTAEPPPPVILADDVSDIVGPTAGEPQRSITVTLIPTLDNVWSNNWLTRVDDVVYNRTSPGGSITLPGDLCEYQNDWGNYPDAVNRDYGSYPFPEDLDILLVPGCNITATNPATRSLVLFPTFQPTWITLTYKTRANAIREKNIITMTSAVRTTNAGGYTTATFNLVYERFPAPGEMWGDTEMAVAHIDPPEANEEAGKVEWIKTQADYRDPVFGRYYYTATVVLTEPLFGSDLTVTQLLVSPFTPTIGTPTFFTAVVKNQGTMTASRYFANEVYVRPPGAPPPASNSDHKGGFESYDGSVKAYEIYAILKPKDHAPNSFDWKVSQPESLLGPGQSITLQTAITFTQELGNYRVYAQADIGYPEDLGRYGKAYASNPEGWGVSPYLEESNVLAASKSIFVPGKYIMGVSNDVFTASAAPGQKAVFDDIELFNLGNLTDTYTITLNSTTWTVDPLPPPVFLRPGKSQLVTVRVAVPTGTPEDRTTQTRLTFRSSGNPALVRPVLLNVIARTPKLYLPIVIKKK